MLVAIIGLVLAFVYFIVRFVYKVWQDKKSQRPDLRIFFLTEKPWWNILWRNMSTARTVISVLTEIHNYGTVPATIVECTLTCVGPTGQKYQLKNAYERPLRKQILISLDIRAFHVFRSPWSVPPTDKVLTQFFGIADCLVPLTPMYELTVELKDQSCCTVSAMLKVPCRDLPPGHSI